ncbi:MAG: hypothetical protein HY912_24180 [Desulfomonile tiedjei]|uniref:Uncharacterized protein n=1 Tax=Desulfomonile tiedjei TaxID=2358 RepID=A0A9D6V5Q8_9BACT|nr:hypothetical protein [Desulfomonile tiedjei]
MFDALFVLGLSVCLGLLLKWAFASLPEERWQILATLPVAKDGPDNWIGVNLTYYGLFSSLATVLSVSMVFLLLGAIHMPAKVTFILVGVLFALCLPASKIIAGIVEKKPQTLTIGGASFVGFLLAPCVVWILNSNAVLGTPHVPAGCRDFLSEMNQVKPVR